MVEEAETVSHKCHTPSAATPKQEETHNYKLHPEDGRVRAPSQTLPTWEPALER